MDRYSNGFGSLFNFAEKALQVELNFIVLSFGNIREVEMASKANNL